ncbi:MAG: hypothetical protein L6435_07410 [Anaerolineae bacterium]|nr:hypothetical protein [Anaerolineae bacterium]
MTSRRWKTTLLLITLILVLAVSCDRLEAPVPPSPAGAAEPTQERRASATLAAATPAPTSAPPAAGSLDLGDAVSVAAGTIGPGGGTIEVSAPGDPLDGLSIEVPPGAYADNVSFEITSREVVAHDLGQHFNPVSPLIEIRGGEALADELLTMTIPIEISADEFAMAFAYDAGSGEVEGLALLESTADSVTVVTRDISRDVLVSAILVDDLYGDKETGFVHGVDDWYFPNYGSFISPGGHCAGQSISAMYYFIEELGSSLYGKYDNYDNRYRDTPTLWADDELGYRLASVTQESLDWDGHGRKFWSAF